MWKALRQIAGDSQVEAALRLLTTEERQEIEEAQAITWVRMSTSSRLVDVVAQQASLDSDKLYDDALVVAVDSTFGGVWKVLLRFVTAELLVQRAAVLYSKARSIGVVRAEMLTATSANLHLTDAPNPTSRYLRSLAIAAARLLEISGQKQVRYVIKPNSRGAVIHMQWGG